MRADVRLLLLTGLLAGCGEDVVAPPGEFDLELQTVAAGLQEPVLVTAPFGDTRLFVVEKRGLIRVVRNGTVQQTPFLDLRSKVSTGGERGLLGLAFHPGYASNGVFVVNYTNAVGDSRISSFKVSGNPEVADPASEQVILAIQQPFANHNGGHVVFSPLGYLYIGMGDGGGAGDPGDNAQNPMSLLGKMLRMNIRDDGSGAVPAGNPFVGLFEVRWEIWSFGVRNPWRFSFDPATSDLYLADVGQDRQEEITVHTGPQGFGRGRNFGWNFWEGSLCFKPATGCRTDLPFLVLPTLVYGHSEGCSVVGGYVYRGVLLEEIRGTYFYGDYCGGWVRSFRHAGGALSDQREWAGLRVQDLTSFGEDGRGELYVVSGRGTVYRIVRKQ